MRKPPALPIPETGGGCQNQSLLDAGQSPEQLSLNSRGGLIGPSLAYRMIEHEKGCGRVGRW
jgi:hypothetical protein